MGQEVRLDKFLADAGEGTRSQVKKYIQKGMVQVNGLPAKEPKQKVEPDKDQVLLKERLIRKGAAYVYYLLHKPAGYVSATEDTKEKTVLELLPKESRRSLFPVGRLDKDTEGLLLITDDGPLAHRLLSPKNHVDKTYYALVEGRVTQEDLERLEAGVDIGEEKSTLPARAKILSVTEKEEQVISEILLTICEGKFHQVKRMVKAVGKRVVYLKRLSMGPLALPEDLKKGEWRPLTQEELEMLKRL